MNSLKTKKSLQTEKTGLRYLALRNHLRQEILTGKLPHNRQIPSEPELCRNYDISRNTVSRAINDLVTEGLLLRHQGKGTFVHFTRSSSQKNLIGMMFPQNFSEVTSTDIVIKGAQEYAEEHGYHLVMAGTMDNPARARDAVARINEAKAVGTMLYPITGPESDEDNQKLVQALQAANQQVVVVDSEIGGEIQNKVSCITCQNFEGSFRLTQYLILLGYKRIAYLRGPHTFSVDQRHAGFVKAMEDAGVPVRPGYDLLVAARKVEEQGLQEVDVLFSMKEPPEAIICLHDLIALNVLHRCVKYGWRVPEDVAVVGFGDSYQARMAHPPLTTVVLEFEKMGRRAMEILIGQIQGDITEPVIERLPCELMIRQSCGRKEQDPGENQKQNLIPIARALP
jgi:GntR family transcriptional regulator, arabinose operon transcriptional repressor